MSGPPAWMLSEGLALVTAKEKKRKLDMKSYAGSRTSVEFLERYKQQKIYSRFECGTSGISVGQLYWKNTVAR